MTELKPLEAALSIVRHALKYYAADSDDKILYEFNAAMIALGYIETRHTLDEGMTLPELPEGWCIDNLFNDDVDGKDFTWGCVLVEKATPEMDRDDLCERKRALADGKTPREACLSAIAAIGDGE